MSGAKSFLFYPQRQLASCIALGVFRDTRNASLADMARFNYFPASPLVAVTFIISGELRLVLQAGNIEEARNAKPMENLSVLPPQDQPIVSWSPESVIALTIGFYPDAWAQLGYDLGDETMPETLCTALTSFTVSQEPSVCWKEFEQKFSQTWQQARSEGDVGAWRGSDRVSDWSRYLLGRLLTTSPGRSVRTLERQLKRLSGQTAQSLKFYTAIEELHRRKIEFPQDSLADLAAEVGFSDQSHMGRAIRRATGFSPGKLNQLIETEEAFWCYRLLGERF